MGHVILLYSIVALFAGLAVAVSGKCLFNNKIMYIYIWSCDNSNKLLCMFTIIKRLYLEVTRRLN